MGSEPFQPVKREGAAFGICLSIVLLSASPRLSPGKEDVGVIQFSPSGFACEIGLAAVTAAEGAAATVDATLC